MASHCELSLSEQQQFRQWIAAHGTPQRVALRCRIVLACSPVLSDAVIAEQLSINRKTVILWCSGLPNSAWTVLKRTVCIPGGFNEAFDVGISPRA